MSQKTHTFGHKTMTAIKQLSSALSRVVKTPFARLTKRTPSGKLFLAIPLPTKRQCIRASIFLIIAILLAWLGYSVYRYFGPHSYAVSSADVLLGPPSTTLKDAITFDGKQKIYTLSTGVAASDTSRQTDSTPVTATIPIDAAKGVTVTDGTNNVTMTIIPDFALTEGKETETARFVYPFRGHDGWLVYSAKSSGVKEDIVLPKENGDTRTFSYTLKLPDSSVARVESDGSIGVYGNTLLSGNITTATESDAKLLQSARENAEKNTLLFSIPKPTIIEASPSNAPIKASYSLNGARLTVTVEGLKNASYPLTIDPSIYVVTAQQFMNGNNETNIDFDVENKVIKKGATTGARFDSWNSTLAMNITKWKQGVAVAGGYIYTVGGVHPDGGLVSFTSAGSSAFVVPSGITNITVKAWGGGGGGGGGGRVAVGGNGGAGGYATSTLTVTPGETLTINVGGGGGGGTGSTSSGVGGGGGGYSGVKRGSTPLLIAAGGAGGGGGGRSNSSYAGGAGGAGGGTSGENGTAGATTSGGGYGSGAVGATGGASNTPSKNTGTAGSSLQGGAGADGRSSQGTDGSANNGGTNGGGDGGSGNVANYYAGAGGGGGGYAGGGGGSDNSSSGYGAGGGGGGSSYITGTGGSTSGGTGTTPGNDTDSDRAGAGNAGTASGTGSGATGTSGAGGIVVISYVSDTGATSTVSWAKFNTTNGTIESANPGSGTCSGWCTSTQYDLPAPRGKFSLVAYNGFMYAIGGEDESCTTANGTGDNGVCKTVYIAKIGANGEPQLWHPTDSNKANWVYWYRDTDLSSPRSSIKAVAYNNRLYLMGGVTSSGGVTSVANSTQIADLTPDGRLSSWSTSATLPYADYGYSAIAYNDRLYLIGGASTIGGAPLASVYYNKINSDGTLNGWQQTTSMLNGRMSNGGDFASVWGAYIYVSGGCLATNASGYCTSIADSTNLASINADGTIDIWNINGGVSDTRTGQSLIAWRNYLYEVGGCSSQNTSTGTCSNALSDIKYGRINQDGEASTVANSVSRGTSPCSGSDPRQCDLPGISYVGNVLTGSAILNGYLYIWGGCNNTTSGCADTSQGVIYTSIGSDGSLTKPTSCGSWSSIDSFCYNASSFPASNGVGAPGTAVANGYIYSIGGFYATSTSAGGMVNNIYYTAPDPTTGAISSWSSVSLTGVGGTSVSYPYAFTRANPSQASTYPNNLYILGGCTNATGVGCPSSSSGYTDSVVKCNLSPAGTPSGCTENGQQQIGTVPGASSAGLGAAAGTVYANYVYLMGGLTYGNNDLKTTRYAKIDDNNNIVSVTTGTSTGGWVESPNLTYYGRRRGSGFGYNGYLYVVGGYDGTSGGGVLADIEFAKINVSDGSIGSWNVSGVSIDERWGLGLTVSNSFAYAIGGCILGSAPTCSAGGQTNSIQTFQVYNNDSGTPAGYSSSANTYSTSPNRIGLSATILNGYLYVAGGCTSTTDCTAATNNVSYAAIDANGAIGSWSNTTAALPANLTGGKLVASGGSLYYIGGKKVEEAACSPTGQSRFEVYNGISGTAVSDLYGSSAFPNSPSSTQTLTYSTLSGPSGIGDNYGGRLSAILCAPQTGNYTFWVSSDDSSELRLSTDSSPSNVSTIASVNGWTNVNEWTKYPSTQQSATIPLVAGHAYYIEANYKEGTGGDHVEIGWQLPDTTVERPISSSRYMYPSTATTSTPQSTIYYATPASGNIASWGTATNSLPSSRVNFGATVWNNRIYVLGGEGTGTGCTGGVCNTVYVSPQLNSGGNITSSWSTASMPFSVARSGLAAIAYANNLYVLGGYDGSNYLSDTQYAQIDSATGTVTGDWTYSTSLPSPIAGGDGFAVNGYVYLIGGRSSDTVCTPSTLVAPINANTTITTGNNPTGVGVWSTTNQRYTGARYGNAAVYNDGKAYVLGGGCGASITYASPAVQQTTLLAQPQVAKYSIMFDTDTDVFPNYWLLNGVDNSIGARWQLKYRSMANQLATTKCATMTTWGQETNFGNVTLGTPGSYIVKNGSGANISCARYFYFNITVDSSQAFGYPDDVSRGPTISDLTLQFTADPSKRLMHGRTFIGGLQMPDDTPKY